MRENRVAVARIASIVTDAEFGAESLRGRTVRPRTPHGGVPCGATESGREVAS
ncbi:hypothetical protein [Nocardia sp. MDA0666]|uniref:hypothetical protein n=1 Tax=Nocardia sp. MDA0666 TaxID=2135448 RepID=UPI001304E0AA|nr:hypothetical protein [Nocardia sp. MDA0666]